MKAVVNMQFKIDYPIEVEINDEAELEEMTAEDFEVLAYQNRNEEMQKMYDCTFEALCTEVICNEKDFIKKYNKE